ncbi:uncharacterized protein LOC119684428 [Teleopsis dalmanni]|uniref:uncharacterized protein LOC119684428 n=1 Tax=Teleopsis dalmanni TaxID=139649 RepID=UPI0018CE6FD6|nr:uncharacterized protein LOC119684428 [Teleopsis dalmanni]
MYECDCIEGYELNKNGYSCQVINSTSTSDGHSKSDEDVLYQKGASFSAKLANDNERDNQLTSAYSYSSSSQLASGTSFASASDEEDATFYSDDELERFAQQQKVNSNDYYISSESINFNSEQQQEYNSNSQEVPEFKMKEMPTSIEASNAKNEEKRVVITTSKPIKFLLDKKLKKINVKHQQQQEPIHRAATTSAAITKPEFINSDAIMNGVNIDDDYYSKQDMSIYDDVNNNQLNLRPISQQTYQNQLLSNTDSQQHIISKITNNKSNKKIIYTNKDKTATAGGPVNEAIVGQYNKISEKSNISNMYNESTAWVNSDNCNLDCGLDGICDNTEEKMRCLCPFGKTGSNCAEESKIRVPKFSKKSWLAFPALRGAYKHVQIRIEFRPESFDGIILLSGERDDLTGDFMALLLNKGFVEFWFDCGSGVGSVRSRETILLNEWNSVIIYRHRWDAWLVLNHGTKVQGRSNGLFSRITFREPVFLGGTGNITGLSKRLPVFSGFMGCIRRFVANEHEYKFDEHPLGDVVKGFDIDDCISDKCYTYPCQHGGKCLPSDQGAVCLCPIGYVGDLCEIRMDLQVPAFNGSSYLRYAPLGDKALIWLELKVILKPEQPDGLILYSGPKKHGDFIALSLNDGFVEFTFDLGSGPAVVRSEYQISTGQWHTIKISRTARLAVLKVDQTPEVMTISSNGFWHLSLSENLFVGGVNHVDKLPLDLKYKPFFIGCIQKIDINEHSLSIISEALGGTNIGNCPHACVARPCGPFAECIPQMENYECRCNAFNAQCNKAAEVPLEELQLNKAKNKSKSLETKHFVNGQNTKTKKSYAKQTKIHNNKEHARYLHKIGKTTLATTTTTKADTTTTTTTTTTASTPTPTTSIHHRVDFEDIEDDIIFRDVHGMHKKYEHNEQGQRNNAKLQQRNENKNTNKRDHQSIKHQQQNDKSQDGYYGIKDDPYQKHYTIPFKLSKLPTHYESFQTNPESDILTFDDNSDFETTDMDDDHPSDYYSNNNSNYDDTDNDDDHTNDNNYDSNVEPSETESEPFIVDETIFDDNDDTESYHRKQLTQDMQRIMANKPAQHAKAPKLVISEYDYDSVRQADDDDTKHDDLLEPVAKEIVEEKTQRTPPPQTHTDWSLLKKLDLSADHESHIGVRKNFGACFAGEDSYFHYNDAETMSQVISYHIDLNLRIKTHSYNGVILWSGRQTSTEENDDFLALGIEDG